MRKVKRKQLHECINAYLVSAVNIVVLVLVVKLKSAPPRLNLSGWVCAACKSEDCILVFVHAKPLTAVKWSTFRCTFKFYHLF